MLFPAPFAQAQVPVRAPSDWARLVPADARLYVEFRDLSVIRHHLRRVGVWDAVSKLGEKELVFNTTTRPWQQRTEQLLGMTTEQAIIRLLGLRTALFAQDPLHWEQGLVFAELGDTSLVQPLLDRWRVRALPPLGLVKRYSVPGGLLLAVRDRTLLFGPESDVHSLWLRAVLLMAERGGPTLADTAPFQELRRELPASFHGLLYALWSDPLSATSVPSSGLNIHSLSVAMDVSADDVSFEVRARGRRNIGAAAVTTQPFVANLPADSLAIWSGRLDVPGFMRGGRDVGPENRFALGTFLARTLGRKPDAGEGVLESLSPTIALVVGREPAKNDADFDQPTVTLVFQTDRPNEALTTFDGIVDFGRFWLTAVSDDPSGSGAALQARRISADGLDIRSLALGHFLSQRTKCPSFDRMELSWTALDRQLLISSSSAHLEHVARALRGDAARCGKDSKVAELLPHAGVAADWLLVRGSVLSRMIQSWLTFLGRQRPDMLSQEFWVRWARQHGPQPPRLGLGLRRTARRCGEAEVVEVDPGSMAAKSIHVGDVILGVNGGRLATTQPAVEVVDRFRAARQSGPVRMTIRRGGETLEVVLQPPKSRDEPLPVPDPIGALRALVTLTSPIDTLTAWRRPGPAGQFDARIVVRWNGSSAQTIPSGR